MRTGVVARAIAAPPSANATTAGVDLYFTMANPDNRFRPGERVAVRLASRESESGLVVPKAALLHDAYGGTWVYVARQPQVYVAAACRRDGRQRIRRGAVAGPRRRDRGS